MRLPLPLFVCLLMGISVPTANAQNRENMIDRLNKLEEELQQIKDRPAQVISAPADGSAPAVAAPGGEGAAQVSVKLTEIQAEIRGFRGKLEELEHEQRKVNTRLEKFERDADARIQALENRPAGAVAPMPPVIGESKSDYKATEKPTEKVADKPTDKPAEKSAEKTEKSTKPVITNNKPEAGKSAKRIEIGKKEEPTKKDETVKKDEATKKTDTATKEAEKPESAKAESTDKTQADKPADKADDGSSKEQYDAAFKALNQGDYDKARAQFSEFVKSHPSDELVGNAYYWLGETYYIKQQYGKSAEEYRKGFEAMPEGTKASDNLFKLSKSLAQDKREKEACVVLAQILKKYATDSKSVARKAANESKKLKCEP